MLPVEPVVLPPCFFCTGPMGATGTRLSLRPLMAEGGTNKPNLAQNMRRDREGVFGESAGLILRDGAEPVIGLRFARTRWRLLRMRF
jgi:hypothetical protein